METNKKHLKSVSIYLLPINKKQVLRKDFSYGFAFFLIVQNSCQVEKNHAWYTQLIVHFQGKLLNPQKLTF